MTHMVAAYCRWKKKGRKPMGPSQNAIKRICEDLGLDYESAVHQETPNNYSGKFYGVWATVINGGEIPEHRFVPIEVASVCRGIDRDFAFAKASKYDDEHESRRYCDLLIASCGVPVYKLEHRHGQYFCTSREALEKLNFGPVTELTPFALWSCLKEESMPVRRIVSGKRVACLFSGGISSLVGAAMLKKDGYKLYLLNFLDGSPEKVRAAMLLANQLDLPIDHHKLPDPENSTAEYEREKANIPKFLARLAFLATWGAKVGVNHLAIPDPQAPASTTEETIRFLGAIAPKTQPVGFLNPVQGMTKQEILKQAGKLKLNLIQARSCEVHPIYCGHCDKCRGWLEAFTANGAEDPRALIK